MIDALEVGKCIIRRRKRNGLTQEELARMLNVTPQAVSKWENGLALPDTSILPVLGFTLGVTIDELLIVKAVPFNEAQDTSLFQLDVANFSIEDWEEAVYIPGHTGGIPQVVETIDVDGRKALFIKTVERPACKRRGMATRSAIPIETNTVVELTFKPLGDTDGMIELWLFDKSNSNFVRVAARGGNYGEDRQFVSEITGLDGKSCWHIIRYHEWQIFRIETKPHTVIVSLLSTDRTILKSFYYDLSPDLPTSAQQCHIVLSQELGYPHDNEWHMKAYIEKLHPWKMLN